MYHSFTITMTTMKVLDLLKDHRKSHVEEYEQQLTGWKADMEGYSFKVNEWAFLGGDIKDRPQQPPKPADYTKDYDNMISMVKDHIEDTLTLDKSDYEIVVQDRWNWKDSFQLTSTMYNNR